MFKKSIFALHGVISAHKSEKRLNMVDLMNLKPVYPRNITCLYIIWANKGAFEIPEVHIFMWENIGRAKIRLLIN